MKYQKLNMEKWPRKEIFKHFIEDVRCVITITADVEVGNVVRFCKEKGYSFYPTFIFIVSHVVNQQEELKIRINNEGELILWDRVDPSYVVFHPEDQLFTRLISQYYPDFAECYSQITADMRKHQNKRAFEINYENQNTFDVSCLPWMHYKSCDLHVYDSGIYLAPVITWGKFQENSEGKINMPLTMQIHHAVADGFHIGQFFQNVEKTIESWT